MAVTYRSGSSDTDSTGVCSAALPAGMVAGDLLVVWAVSANSTSSAGVVTSAASGFTQIGQTLYNATLDHGCEFYYKIATGSETSIDFQMSDDGLLIVACFDVDGAPVESVHGMLTAGTDQDTDSTTNADILSIASHTSGDTTYVNRLIMYGLSVQYEHGGGNYGKAGWPPADLTQVTDITLTPTFTGFYTCNASLAYGSGATQKDVNVEPQTDTGLIGPAAGGWGKAAFFGRAVIDLNAGVAPNIDPDAQRPYERLRVSVKALPFYLDTRLLRGMDEDVR